MPGLSTWTGLHCLVDLRRGDIVEITSAARSVGLIAGQLAKRHGCTVIGVAGGARKRAMLVGDFGFDTAIEYKAESNMTDALGRACPQGVDVLFENVGNAMNDAALPLMRMQGRVVICGQIADYGIPPDQRPGIRNTDRFVSHRLTLRGLFVFDHAARFAEVRADIAAGLREGALSLPETIIDGFEVIPGAFTGPFTGQPAGRTIIRVD